MVIHAQYIDALSSEQYKVIKLNIKKSGYIHVSGWGVNFVTHISKLKFSDRVGTIPRQIIFPNGAIGYSTDHENIDKLLKKYQHKFTFTFNRLFKYFYDFIYYISLIGGILAIIYGLNLTNRY